MSQAEELLDTLANIQPRLADEDTEPHIVIGGDRVIKVPNELKRIAVQYDHNVETVTFDCPRYWDDLDMSKLGIYINYMRKDGEIGTYKARNVVVDDTDQSIMHFDWTISKNVSITRGELKFLVCIKKADSDGNEVNHWNSELNTEMYVSEGLETGEIVVSPYPDIISQWEEDVQAVKDILLEARDSGELDGATFTPSLDEDCNLSWTNDRGRENPATVNIKGYSPSILVREIEGGKQFIITDIRQSQTVTIMDGADGANGADGKEGYSPSILVREIDGGKELIITDIRQSQTVTIMDGADGKDGTNGADGADGVSPIVSTTNISGGYRVTITDANGPKSFDILNGINGADGSDGVSPTANITAINGGHRVSITDVNGTHTFDVMDGTNDMFEAVTQYMNNFVYIGDVEPASGPTLWFDTSRNTGA